MRTGSALALLGPALIGASQLGGCNFASVPDPSLSARDAAFMALVPKAEVDPHFARYLVDDPTHEAPGTIVIETAARRLYLVLPGGKAVRYGVTVGDEAYGWTGKAVVSRRPSGPHGILRPRW